MDKNVILAKKYGRAIYEIAAEQNSLEKTEEELVKIIKDKFDLTPNGIIEYLGLKEPIYTRTTNYGHFGKENLPWEKIIKI